MKEEDLDLIEKFIFKKASEQEMVLFNQKLNDIEFRHSYEEVKHLYQNIKISERQRLFQLLKDEENKKNSLSSFFIPMGMAASVIILIVAGYLVWKNPAPSNQDLAKQYYTSYTELSFDRPRGESELFELKESSLSNYKNGQIDSAIYKLNKVFTEDPEDEEAIILSGLCYLENQNFTQAISQFKRVKENHENGFIKWYLAIAYIGDNNPEQAKSYLNDVAKDPSSKFQKTAKKLLKELK